MFFKYADGSRMAEAAKEEYKAEARFLRAWYYAMLLRHYGGVALIGDDVYETVEEDIPKYYDVLQVLSKYKGFYYIDDLSKEKQISNDMERLQDEEQLIIYVNHNAQIMDLENTHFLQRDEEWDVYLMSKE